MKAVDSTMLFRIDNENVHPVAPQPFAETHYEEHLQRWADKNPHLLNDGQPMLSLGREIETQHNRYLDNLFLDGNGQLVVAELKRGSCPREVVTQIVDYGAYVHQLSWADIENLHRQNKDGDLPTSYSGQFGFALDTSASPKHRLLIVAERFDPSVQDAVSYLINGGIDMTLMCFSFFELENTSILDVRVTLGELPEQRKSTSKRPATKKHESDGYRNWLAIGIREELIQSAENKDLKITLGKGDRYVSFVSQPWPHVIGDCRFYFALNASDIGIHFYCRNECMPDALYEAIKKLAAQSDNEYADSNLKRTDQWTTLSHSLPHPELGDQQQVSKVVDAGILMLERIGSLVRSLSTEPPQ